MALKLTQGNLPLFWVRTTVSRAWPYNTWQACHLLHFETPTLLVCVLYMCLPSKEKLVELPVSEKETQRERLTVRVDEEGNSLDLGIGT